MKSSIKPKSGQYYLIYDAIYLILSTGDSKCEYTNVNSYNVLVVKDLLINSYRNFENPITRIFMKNKNSCAKLLSKDELFALL